MHLAIAYSTDGSITGYRNGEVYGTSYRKSVLQEYGDSAVVTFGVIHLPAAGNQDFKGKILEAKLYDVALSSHAIRASANAGW